MNGSDSTWQFVSRAGQGGTVTALAGANGMLFTTTPAGIRRSVDGGRSWTVAGRSSSVPFADAITLSPDFQHDGTLLAGAADGLHRSTDRGESWRRVLVGRVLALAAAPGVWLAGTESDGILRSEDAGQTWTGANAGLLDLTATALVLSPDFEHDRTAFAGTTSGLYRTRNGARAWRAAETEVEEPAIQCLGISPDFAKSHLVLAGTEADGLLRSDDGGATWHSVPSLPERSVTALAFGADGSTAAATESGVALSYDGGQTWRPTALQHGAVLSLLVDGGTLFAGLASDGLASSTDAGRTWSWRTAELEASLLLSLVVGPHRTDHRTLLVGGPQDGIRISTDAGHSWRNASLGLEQADVLALATTPAHAFAATSAGLFRGELNPEAELAEPSWRLCLENPVRVVAAAAAGGLLVTAADAQLVVSGDEGTTWRSLQTPFEGEVVSLALAPDGTLYVGTARPDGAVVVWRSADQGTRWQRWLLERATGGLLPIAVSPRHAADETVWVGVDHRVLHPIRQSREVRAGERRPLWRGVSLGDLSAPVTALAVPNHRTLVAATSGGVFVSRDGGEAFNPFSHGLPRLPIVALAIADDDVYALALGGGVWRSTIGAGW